MGFHEYHSKWDPIIDEILEAQMKQTNISGRLQMEEVLGRLQKEKTGKPTNDILLFQVREIVFL